MSFSVGRGFFTSFISNERINTISNARSESEACVMTLWEKIKNFFFHTHQKEALHLLYKLTHAFEYHDAAAFASYFFQLRNLVKPEDQDQFYITRTCSEMIGQLANSSVLVLLSERYGYLSLLNSQDIKTCYLSLPEESKETESPEERHERALKEAIVFFKKDFSRNSYVFQSDICSEKNYNLKGKECSDQLFDSVLKIISDICLGDQDKYINTLLLNTQKSFLAANAVMCQHNNRFPITRDHDLVLIQESRTHRQPDGSIIVQNHICFVSNPQDESRVYIHSCDRGITPLFGKISVHNVWMVTNEGIQGIGLNMEVTPA